MRNLTTAPLSEVELVERYVERWFKRSGNTSFPTVRHVARYMRLPIPRIIELVEGGDNLMTTYWPVQNYDKVPNGDRFVETYNELPEEA